MTNPIPPTQRFDGGLARIYDTVQMVLPGVQFPVIQAAVWDAIEEFCIDSTFLRQRIGWIMPPEVTQVDLNPLSGSAVVCWVLSVEGLIHFEVHPPAVIVDLGPYAKQQRQGYSMVAWKPTYLAEDFPCTLLDMWHEGIKDGALSRLYGQPMKPYSSEKLGSFHGTRFQNAVRRARDAANRYNVGPAQFTYPYFARGRRRSA